MESERKAGEERLLTCTSPPLSLSLSLSRVRPRISLLPSPFRALSLSVCFSNSNVLTSARVYRRPPRSALSFSENPAVSSWQTNARVTGV